MRLNTGNNSNLDRFSRPLHREFVSPSLDYIEEQRELNKIDIVRSYLLQFDEPPDAEDVQEHLHHIDMDLDKIEECIKWVF